MARRHLTRREFLGDAGRLALGAASMAGLVGAAAPGPRPVVSIVRIRKGKDVASLSALARPAEIDAAVEEAIELLGGAKAIARGKERVLIKPNLGSDQPFTTTRPQVVGALARLMKAAGKDVSIGEGSVAAKGFTVVDGQTYRTRKAELIEPMQRYLFELHGYSTLARELDVPLVNLHLGELAKVEVPGALAYPELQLHRALVDTDLLCSVPVMKTHSLATVSLGMKNLIGLYPGSVHGTVRHEVHEHAAAQGSPGAAYETLDMVRANKLGLVVVDAYIAMEGNGPYDGHLLNTNLIIAGTNPLATDMVAASVMGFSPREVPTFTVAHRIGMAPTRLDQIEIRGVGLEKVRHRFDRPPRLLTWNDIRQRYLAPWM